VKRPSHFLRLESPLQRNTLLWDRKVEASAWTTYAYGNGSWSHTFSRFGPNSRGAVEEETEFLIEYVRRHDGRKIYTDCDEHTPRLDASLCVWMPCRSSKLSLRPVVPR
jgi:hypothetical protein